MALALQTPEWLKNIATRLNQGFLWQRLVKYTIATTSAVIISVLPQVIAVYGLNTFLIPMTTVFAHAGQRLGPMVESIVKIVSGATLGLAWAAFGLFLSSLCVETNAPAAYGIRAAFLAAAVICHGLLRSKSPRLFQFVLLLLMVSTIILVGKAEKVTAATATGIMYPILTAVGVLLVVNVAVFSELSSSFLGKTTIETLAQTSATLKDASNWFLSPGVSSDASNASNEAADGGGIRRRITRVGTFSAVKRTKTFRMPQLRHVPEVTRESQVTSLATLTDRKAKLRAKLKTCKAVQEECTFELSYSALPPRKLKPISTTEMSRLVQHAIGLVGACESKFALEDGEGKDDAIKGRGYDNSSGDSSPASTQNALGRIAEEEDEVEMATRKVKYVKARRGVKSGDAELLESILAQIRHPVRELQQELDEAIDAVTSCLAYCYDVPKLPSGALAPDGISLEEVDLRIDQFKDAITRFDESSARALVAAASKDGFTGSQIDIMPRSETFLISSFILGLRQAAVHAVQMLNHSRHLVERRQARHDRARLWLPKKISWRKWLASGGEEDAMALPASGRREARTGAGDSSSTISEEKTKHTVRDAPHPPRSNDEERALPTAQPSTPVSTENGSPAATRRKALKRQGNSSPGTGLWIRGCLADMMEGTSRSDDLSYALKLAFAVFLVSWPGFALSTKSWYQDVRGIWAPLQLILVFEVAIGSSLLVFVVRASGVFFGCAVGLISYEIGDGNRIALVAVLFLGIVPSAYVQLGTPYVKAGMVANVSMAVVALATINKSGTAWENCLKRFAAFMIGGSVALLVEVALYPVRARDRLVESLSASLRQITNMQSAVAVGIDNPRTLNLQSVKLNSRFNRSKEKAEAALAAAETFLPFCLSEPRLKGSFRSLEPIYGEMIYVLHQIIDRMENMVQLRKIYGNTIMEELNPEVFAYRRNVAASNALILFAVNEALTTRLPLPQFIPSSRLAQLRLISRVREVLLHKQSQSRHNFNVVPSTRGYSKLSQADAIRSLTQHSFLAYNASTAGQMELIEYLEELVDLAKMLVGVNAFRSGVLEKPSFAQYTRRTPSWAQADKPEFPSAVGVGVGRGDDPPQSSSVDAHDFAPPPRRTTGGISMRQRPAGGAAEDGRRRQAANRMRELWAEKRLPSGADAADEEPAAGELPASLQRVGSRLREGRRLERARTLARMAEKVEEDDGDEGRAASPGRSPST